MRDLRWWEFGFLASAVAFLALHVALYLLGVSPQQFVDSVGAALMPDIGGHI